MARMRASKALKLAREVFVTATGALLGTMTNNGGGKYSGQYSVVTSPENITVESSLGGSVSKAVAPK